MFARSRKVGRLSYVAQNNSVVFECAKRNNSTLEFATFAPMFERWFPQVNNASMEV